MYYSLKVIYTYKRIILFYDSINYTDTKTIKTKIIYVHLFDTKLKQNYQNSCSVPNLRFYHN